MHFEHRPAAALNQDTELRASWDRLNDAGLALPFMTADAVGAALAVFGDGSEKLVCAAREGQLVAMTVLSPRSRWHWATFQPSQLPLGAWVAEPAVPLDDLVRALLRQALPATCLVLSFSQIDPLQAPRAHDAADSCHDDYISTSWLEVDGDFDGYWATRGKNLRQNMRKQRNKLATEGIVATMRQLRDVDDVTGALARYGHMESAGWKASKGTAIHLDNDQGRFYSRLLQDAAWRGELLITEYLFDDRTVAMNLSLLRRGVLVVLKTAYDESQGNALSPASLLREDELREYFAAGNVKRIEYYGRTMEWHTKLTQSSRTLYHLTTYRWGWVKSLAQWRRRRQAARVQPSSRPETQADQVDVPARQAQ